MPLSPIPGLTGASVVQPACDLAVSVRPACSRGADALSTAFVPGLSWVHAGSTKGADMREALKTIAALIAAPLVGAAAGALIVETAREKTRRDCMAQIDADLRCAAAHWEQP